jgi:crossover junction endodeoxyribonuclease RusA
MTSLTLTLPWPSADLSPNARVHPLVRHRAAKSAKNYAFNMAFALMGPLGIRKGTWRGAIEVALTFHPSADRRFDLDNALAREKARLDGVALALGVDDSAFTFRLARGEKRKPPCVVMTLTPAEVVVPFRGQIT